MRGNEHLEENQYQLGNYDLMTAEDGGLKGDNFILKDKSSEKTTPKKLGLHASNETRNAVAMMADGSESILSSIVWCLGLPVTNRPD